MLLKQIHDPYLSQYAYLIGCPESGEALIIDAQRDVDRYLDLAAGEGLKITAAAETHIHADFLGGVRQLVERTGGVEGYLSKTGGEDWQYAWAQDHKLVHLLGDGDTFTLGDIEIMARHLPGHTPEHLCFLIKDTGIEADVCFALVSGDFMHRHLLGSLYAPFGPDFTEAAGSYLREEARIYLMLEHPGQLDDCVRQLVRIGLDNIGGYALIDAVLNEPLCNPFFQQIQSIEITEIDAKAGTVLDVRSTDEYAEAHVPGAVNLPHNRLVADAEQLPGKDEPLTVHCGSGERASLASAALARMGYKVIFADGAFADWKQLKQK